MRLLKILLFYFLLVFVACSSQTSQNTVNEVDITDSVLFAEQFSLQHDGSIVQVKVYNPWQGATDVCYTYTLVPKADTISTSDFSTIQVPIERVVCMSSTYVAFFDAIGSSDIVCGLSGANYVYNKAVSERVKEGTVREVGYDQTLNYELLVSLKPDVVLCYGVGQESMASLEKLRELGVKIIFIGEYLENHPLGKLEWIKVFGALVGKESVADSVFNKVKNNYLDACLNSDSLLKRPKVFLNMPFKDVWYTPGNQSYFVQLIRDAGGEYLFNGLTGSRSYPISFERAYEAGLKADIWLCPGAANSLNQISDFDPRLTNLAPFVKGSIFNNNRRTTMYGGSDFWEGGTVNPDIILKDLLRIFQPDSLPQHELYYFQQLR